MNANSTPRALGLTAPLASKADVDAREGGYRYALTGETQTIPANDPLYLMECDGCPFAAQPGHALARECLELCINGFRLLGSDLARHRRPTDRDSRVTWEGSWMQAQLHHGSPPTLNPA